VFTKFGSVLLLVSIALISGVVVGHFLGSRSDTPAIKHTQSQSESAYAAPAEFADKLDPNRADAISVGAIRNIVHEEVALLIETLERRDQKIEARLRTAKSLDVQHDREELIAPTRAERQQYEYEGRSLITRLESYGEVTPQIHEEFLAHLDRLPPGERNLYIREYMQVQRELEAGL
jgi:hypothetical protein